MIRLPAASLHLFAAAPLFRRTVVCALLFTALAAPAFAQQNAPSMTQLDEMRTDGKLREVHAALQEILEQDPQNTEALWRLSRSYVDIGFQTKGQEERASLYKKGMEVAEEAISADPKSSDAELTYAIAVGRLALESGTRQKVELSRAVKEHVDRAIELNPKNAVAYHVRGRWNYGIADLGFFSKAIVKLVYGGLPDASFEQAARDFEHAIQLEDRVVDYLELGRTYMRLDRNDDAKQMLKRALVTANYDAA
ncbi:MAG TPA: hypothetical protein VFG50_09735, partial [Rhodothermales bacterium]|nr:hypothetical protein [Rhodothermales bacterium]